MRLGCRNRFLFSKDLVVGTGSCFQISETLPTIVIALGLEFQITLRQLLLPVNVLTSVTQEKALSQIHLRILGLVTRDDCFRISFDP
jgi:hypothetical protein